MKTVIVGFVLGVVSLGVLSGLPASDDAVATVTKPCVVITGADSKVSKCAYHRIAGMDDWTQVWLEHKGHKPDGKYDHFHNPAGVPLVDFTRFTVIGIFQGTGGNSAGISAVSLTEQPDRIVFRFVDLSYQTIGPGKSTTSYAFFVIPRSAKPVVLEEDVQSGGRTGIQPLWKERITFPKS
jgi:hypothetical protein